LPAGQSITINFSGQVKADVACAGSYINTGKILYNDGSGPKESTTTASFSINQVSSSMNVIKTVIKPKSGGVGPGDEVIYKITYTNNGLAAINGFKIIDIWPKGLDYIESTPRGNMIANEIVWNFPTVLQPGQTNSITIIGKVKSNIR